MLTPNPEKPYSNVSTPCSSASRVHRLGQLKQEEVQVRESVVEIVPLTEASVLQDKVEYNYGSWERKIIYELHEDEGFCACIKK